MRNIDTTKPGKARRAALAGSAALFLALAAPVAAWAAPPGNNGHIQVHDSATGVDVDSNDPKDGCFYIDAFGFDPNQVLNWSVFQGTAGNLGNEVASGQATFTAVPPHGQDISGQIALPQGKYVVFEDDSAGRKSHEIMVTSDCNSGIPMVNGKVLGVAGAIAAPAMLGYTLLRRRNAAL